MSTSFRVRRRVAVFALAAVGAVCSVAPLAWLDVSPAYAFAARVGSGGVATAQFVASSSNARRASSAFAHFLATYWDARTRTFYVQSDHRSGADGSVKAPIWWVAQAWDVVMDDYERTRSTSDRQLIDDVFDGWLAHNGGFNSSYNDDRGWWALAATRAYEMTGERRFLNTAVALADDQWSSWDTTFGGGLWWRQDVHDQKNVATNAPAAMTNATLFQITGRPRFRNRAIALFAWVDGKLRFGSRLDDRWERANGRIATDYTYNYGTYIGAALELYAITGEQRYVDKATTLADSSMSRLTSSGVLRNEGTGDGGGFKGIFMRNFQALIAPGQQAVSSSKQQSYAAFVAHNSAVAWYHRTPARLWGGNWAAFAPSGPIDVLTDTSAVSLFEAQALTSP